MKNLLMAAIAIFGLASISMAQLPYYIPSDGLVGYWPFNGNANDESINGNNGNVNGATLTNNRFGILNNAFAFNGISDFIEFQDDNSLDLTNQYSISIWVELTDYSLNNPNEPMRTMIGKPLDASGGGYSFRAIEGVAWNGNSLSYNAGWNTPTINGGLGSLDTIPLNDWTNVVFTYDGLEAKLFKNGVLTNTGSFSFSLANSLQPLYIGKEFNSSDPANNRWFKGKLDDIGIWNRALTEEEITSLYFGSSLGVNEVSQSNLFSVFPNPAQSEINVNLDAKLLGSVFTIYDNIGKAVKTGKINSVNTVIELNDLSGGIYTFSVGENKKQAFKVIKE